MITRAQTIDHIEMESGMGLQHFDITMQMSQMKLLSKDWTDSRDKTWDWKVWFRTLLSHLEHENWMRIEQEGNSLIYLSPCAIHQKCEITLRNKDPTDWQGETWVWKVWFRTLMSNLEHENWMRIEQERNNLIYPSPCAIHQKCEIKFLNKDSMDWQDETWVWKVWFRALLSNSEHKNWVGIERERTYSIHLSSEQLIGWFFQKRKPHSNAAAHIHPILPPQWWQKGRHKFLLIQ